MQPYTLTIKMIQYLTTTVVNREMEKKMKTFNNIKLCDTDLDRPYFTNHGQHLNSSGKEAISNKLSIVIKDLFVKKQPTPICMPWKEILGETNLNHKNRSKLTLNTETSSIHKIIT